MLAWLVPACASIVLSVGVFLVLGLSDYENTVKRESSELNTHSLTVARRLAAEVLIGERGSPQSVSDVLKSELGLTDIQIIKDTGFCNANELRTTGYCVVRLRDSLSVIRPLPMVQAPTYIQVSKKAPSYVSSLNPSVLLWSVLPVLFLLGMGIIGVRWLLRKYVLHPVEQLADAAYRGTEPPEYWPTEIANLSSDLREAFARRDFAMVGQMASGVIHDIKTLLHSTWTAAQLAEEQPMGSEKRLQRLELFLRAGQINFSKMQALIQTTLDGSREIRVNPLSANLASTLEQAIGATKDLAQRSQVTIELETDANLQPVRHDPIQLERVLTNLVKNAVEATAQSAVRPARVWVKASTNDIDSVRISVEDNGPGLGSDPKKILSSMRSTKSHGSGLGLVISRKIVEAHLGTLSAGASRSLGGARFDIVLPKEGGLI